MSEWIKKKIKKGNEKSSNWITKKEKPTQWITKKEKSSWIKKKKRTDDSGEPRPPNKWIQKKEKPTQWIKRKEKSHGGGIGVQTHGVKLARALNTGTPDHTKYLNEHGYLKGGVPVKNG